MTVSNSWNPSGRRARILRSRLTLQGELLSNRVIKKAPTRVLARRKEQSLIVENAISAARDHRGNVASTEAQGSVGSEGGISDQAWAIAIRIDRIFGQKDGIVGRQGCGDD